MNRRWLAWSWLTFAGWPLLATASPPSLFQQEFAWPAWFEQAKSSEEVIGKERLAPVSDAEQQREVLQLTYPAGSMGSPETGGAMWTEDLVPSAEVVTLQFQVRFGPGFEFARGGKLPGLIGGRSADGKTITGGVNADGRNGWSVRVNWREDGKAILYIYHMDDEQKELARRPGRKEWKWGEILYSPVAFVPDRWYRVTVEVKMNQPRFCDYDDYASRESLRLIRKNSVEPDQERYGRARLWVEESEACIGEQPLFKPWKRSLPPALEVRGLCFRRTPELKIDAFVFDSFFGGNEPGWEAKKEEVAFFDRFALLPGTDR
jgi:hypothetical protein